MLQELQRDRHPDKPVEEKGATKQKEGTSQERSRGLVERRYKRPDLMERISTLLQRKEPNRLLNNRAKIIAL